MSETIKKTDKTVEKKQKMTPTTIADLGPIAKGLMEQDGVKEVQDTLNFLQDHLTSNDNGATWNLSRNDTSAYYEQAGLPKGVIETYHNATNNLVGSMVLFGTRCNLEKIENLKAEGKEVNPAEITTRVKAKTPTGEIKADTCAARVTYNHLGGNDGNTARVKYGQYKTVQKITSFKKSCADILESCESYTEDSLKDYDIKDKSGEIIPRTSTDTASSDDTE